MVVLLLIAPKEGEDRGRRLELKLSPYERGGWIQAIDAPLLEQNLID